MKGLEFYREWDIKRKKTVLNNQSHSSNNEWDSSSCSASALKRRKCHSDWHSGGAEEVGDNDELQFMGREIFEPASSIGLEKIRTDEHALPGQKDDMVEMQCSDPIMHLEATQIETKQTTNIDGYNRIGHQPLTLDGTRNYMRSIMTELKEAREKMLIWMRQEMQKIMYEGSGSPSVRVSFGGEGGEEMEFQKQQGSGHNGNGIGIAVLGNESGEMNLGGEANCSGGSGFAEQNSLVDGAEYVVQKAGRDLNFETQSCGRGGEDIAFGKENGNSDKVDLGFCAQQSVGQAEVGIGMTSNCDGRMDIGNHSRGSSGGVAMTVQNGSVEALHLGIQNRRDGLVGFRTPNVVPGEMTFGAPQTGGSIGVNYTSQASGGSGMVFGRQSVDSGTKDGAIGRAGVEIRSTTGFESSNTPANSAPSHQVNALHILGEERTPDLIGMQNQDLQSSVALTMMWNNVAQNPRGVSQDISASGVHGFNFDSHIKLGNGGINTYRGLVCGSTAYENSAGMMNSPTMQTQTSTSGMHLPMVMQDTPNTNLNSSSMQPLMGMQNQAAVQNFSGMQNFLGLSMNGNISRQVLGEGMNRHAFPGFYLNEHPQHVLTARSNILSGTSGMHGRPHKRGRTVHGMDILELNT